MFNKDLLLSTTRKPTTQLTIHFVKMLGDTKLLVSLPSGKSWEIQEYDAVLEVPINTRITIEMTSINFYTLSYSSESNNVEILSHNPPSFLYLQVTDTNPAEITIYDN